MNSSLTAVGETVIQRVTYSIAGQSVAVRVIGDPTSSNNGLFYIHSDHLGSTSVLTKYSDGYIRADSLARYAPFGGYRTGGPNQITDRAFTGQKENMGLGLYYYNARYYLPGVGRFLSADTLVPDPQNPQSLNRFSYTRNNPLNLVDPTGHRECGIDCDDPLPHELPLPVPPAPATFPEPIFYGLPIETDAINWANGFGANSYANKYANPESSFYNKTYKNSGGLHPGLDFGADSGTSVYSNVHGRIQHPSPYPGDAGFPSNVVVLLDTGMFVIFGHVQGIDGLEHDREIFPGDIIGTVGDQGSNSHLHLALRQTVPEGERVYNPANYFADSAILNSVSWSGYVEGENLYSISSFLYQPSGNQKNYWIHGDLAVGVTR